MPYEQPSMGPIFTTELVGLFKKQLRMSNLHAGEECLIITDSLFEPAFAAACLGAALDLGASAHIVTLPSSIEELPRSVRAGLAESDLIVGFTSHRLHYFESVANALASGSRALSVQQPFHVLQRLTADPTVISRTRRGAALLDRASRVRITSPHGTDLHMDKSGRAGIAHYGVADIPGHFDFWGAAMVEAAILEGTLEGTLVLNTGDIIFHLGRFIEKPTTITFEAGRVVDIAGGLDAFLLQNHLESYGDPKAFMAGHIAWGTDHRAIWTAPAVQFPQIGTGNTDSEGFYGAVQVEIGSNNDQFFRGLNNTPAHVGLSMLESSLELDGERVIDQGKFVGSLAES